MNKLLISTAICAGFLLSPSAAIAGPDEDVRDAARAEATRLRSEGWPKDRCFAGIIFFGNTVAEGNGNILAGDKLLSINATNTEKYTTDEIATLFGSLAPSSTISITIMRGSTDINLKQYCGNLGELYT